jgi:hypothetical protein
MSSRIIHVQFRDVVYQLSRGELMHQSVALARFPEWSELAGDDFLKGNHFLPSLTNVMYPAADWNNEVRCECIHPDNARIIASIMVEKGVGTLGSISKDHGALLSAIGMAAIVLGRRCRSFPFVSVRDHVVDLLSSYRWPLNGKVIRADVLAPEGASRKRYQNQAALILQYWLQTVRLVRCQRNWESLVIAEPVSVFLIVLRTCQRLKRKRLRMKRKMMRVRMRRRTCAPLKSSKVR